LLLSLLFACIHMILRWGSTLNLFILFIQWRLIFLWWVLKVRCRWSLAVRVIDFDSLSASSEVSVCRLMQYLVPLASDLAIRHFWQPLCYCLDQVR
jgi:hypothetical protein